MSVVHCHFLSCFTALLPSSVCVCLQLMTSHCQHYVCSTSVTYIIQILFRSIYFYFLHFSFAFFHCFLYHHLLCVRAGRAAEQHQGAGRARGGLLMTACCITALGNAHHDTCSSCVHVTPPSQRHLCPLHKRHVSL